MGVCAPEKDVAAYVVANWQCPENSVLPDCADFSVSPPDCRKCIKLYIDGAPVKLESRVQKLMIPLGNSFQIFVHLTKLIKFPNSN